MSVQFSKPTKEQIVKYTEVVIVAFVATFVSVWAGQPDPFTKAAVVASLSAAGVAVYGLIKSLAFSS